MSQVTADALHDTALSPALFADGADRRESPRIPLRHPVKVGPPNQGPESLVSARDLSAQGLFIDADRPVRVGARFSVEIVLDDDRRVYVPEAEVAYNREHGRGTGFGVRFVVIDPAARALLQQEIDRHFQVALDPQTMIPSIVAEEPLETPEEVVDVSDLPTLAPTASQMPEVPALTGLPAEPAIDSHLEWASSLAPAEPEEAHLPAPPRSLRSRGRAVMRVVKQVGPGVGLL